MRSDDINLLIYLAEKPDIKTSTLIISKELKVSQQTISRQLRDLESKGLVKRTLLAKGMRISLEKKGMEELSSLYKKLGQIINKKSSIFGIVEKGIGEGKYYMSMKQYQKQFMKKLGYNAFPGTLNFRIKRAELMQFLSSIEPIMINGFSTKSRTYGALTCYGIKIDSTKGHIIVPERTRHHEEIVEIIAPFYLRDKLKVKDGDKIKLTK